MPRTNRRRRNPGIASRPRYGGGGGSKSDSSSDEWSHPPVEHRITTSKKNPVSRPAAENVSEEESSGGWSSNPDFSGHCDDEPLVQEVTPHHPIESIQEQAEAVEDGLLLVSDDENDLVGEEDEDYLSSDSALRVHRAYGVAAEPPLNSYELFDGTNLETSGEVAAAATPNFPAIPLSVAILDQRHMEQFETSEPSMDDSSGGKCYDARYDGSLHDLTQGLHLSYSSHGNDDEDDDNDSSSSSLDEMKGYLSTGDLRCPNIFLTPNVGERPPTPPSPNRRKASSPLPKSRGGMARIPSPQDNENGTPEQSIALIEIQEESSEITWTPPTNSNSSILSLDQTQPEAPPKQEEERETKREIQVAPFADRPGTSQRWDRLESASSRTPDSYQEHSNHDFNAHPEEADYCQEENDAENYFAYDAPPSVYPSHSLPDGSGVMTSSHVDELSDAMRLLVENQTKSRRMVGLLIVALICALVALAAVAGGVVALLLSGGDEPATTPSPLPSTPVAPVSSPMVVSPVRAPSVAPKAVTSLAPVLPAPMVAVTGAPISVPVPVVLPPVFQEAPTQPPTPKPSLRPVTAAPVRVTTNTPVASGDSAPSTPVSFGSTPTATIPTTPGTSPTVPSTAVPTSASIKIP